MTMPNRADVAPPARPGRARTAVVVLALVAPACAGCGREYFRQWADQDVSEAVFEKTRDPRWAMNLFTIEPPALSRFADPYDPDRPPAPPDDYAAEALSPVPQWPIFRLLTPAEGTGYLEVLQSGRRYEPPPPKATAPSPVVGGPAPVLTEPTTGRSVAPPPNLPNPLPPAGDNPAPFQPGPNSGPNNPGTSPIIVPERPPANPPGPGATPPQASSRTRSQDSGVSRVAFQAPAAAPAPSRRDRLDAPVARRTQAPARPERRPDPTQRGPAVGLDPSPRIDINNQPPPTQPGPGARTPGGAAMPNPAQGPGAPPALPPGRQVDPTEHTPRVDLDPDPGADRDNQPIPRPDLTPEQVREAETKTTSFAAVLNPGLSIFNEATAAALAARSRPFIIDPAMALNLALINSRAYQFRVENVYVAALAVTLARFAFQPQFYAGMSPRQGVSTIGFPSANPANQFTYRTRFAPGGQASTNSYGTVAGVGRAFSFGSAIAAGFANQVVFNFVGATPKQPFVQSSLPLTYVQPFLSGAGRAVNLEPLTNAERQLLYEVRNFARFRQEFMPWLLTIPNQLLDNPGLTEQTAGYLQILQQEQQVENDQRNLASFEQILKVYKELAKGASSGLSGLQVDQVDRSVQTARQALIQDETQFRIYLDQFKFQLGIPPDVPILLDRYPTSQFSKVFDDISLWEAKPEHNPEELRPIIADLPMLENIVLDGRPLFKIVETVSPRERYLDRAFSNPERQEEALLAAERLALDNRLDLMNARAVLYDVWRQLAVQANGLLGVFNVQVTNQIFTPQNTSNPFGFLSEAKQFSLVMQTELPLVRVAQRNSYRQALINFRRQQRALQFQEDTIKYQIRTEIRNLILNVEQYEISKRNLFLTLRQKDQTLQQIVAPPQGGGAGAGSQQAAQTLNLVQTQTSVLTLQNTLILYWVTYQAQRLGLYRDLGILPFDEWEAYYEFFPSARKPGGNGAAPGNAGPAAGRAGGAARPAGP